MPLLMPEFGLKWPMKSCEIHSLDDLANLDVVPKAELKYDGRRGQVLIGDDRTVRTFSSSLKEQTSKLPQFDCLGQVLPPGTVLDCEYVVFKDGKWATLSDGSVHQIPNFTYTARMMGCKTRSKVVERESEIGAKVSIVIFDILFWNGIPVMHMKWSGRRVHLENMLLDESGKWGTEHIRLSPLIPYDAESIAALAAAGAEGIMLKGDGPWIEGKRPWGSYFKLKFRHDHDVVITGFTYGAGKYEGRAVGSVWFGQWRDGALETRGKCAGMEDWLREDMFKYPDRYLGQVMTVNVFDPVPGSESFRMPQFKELRDDKISKECTWDD